VTLVLMSGALRKMCIVLGKWLVVGQLGLQATCCPVSLMEQRWGRSWM